MNEPGVYRNLIGGEWLECRSEQTFSCHDPASTHEIVGVFQESDAWDIDDAVAAARQSYETWRLVPAGRRAEILFRTAQLLSERKERYAHAITREMGKVLAESRAEVQQAIDSACALAGEGRRLAGQVMSGDMPDAFQATIRMPLGVCGVMTPWNFPLALPALKIFAALIVGNTVVLKPAEDAPMSSFNLVQTLMDAGLPPGVVNIVTGGGLATAEALVAHADVNVVAFTGGQKIGSRVASLAAEHLKRLSLEMSGRNSMIVLDDANLDLALRGAIQGAFCTTGQRCTSTSHLLVQRAVAEELTERLVRQTRELRVGSGLDDRVTVGPCINQEQLYTIINYVDVGQQEGAELLWGGQHLHEGSHAHGYFFAPTIFGGVRREMRIAQEAIFGPVLCVLQVDSLEEAVALANEGPGSLAASIYTHDINRAFRTVHALNSTMVLINTPTIGPQHALTAGDSSVATSHRDDGIQALEVFSQWKKVYAGCADRLPPASGDRWPESSQ